MPARRPSEICFFCPETLYQDLVRELAKRLGRGRGSIERDFSRLIELVLTRLVERPVLLAELLSRPPLGSAPRRRGVKAAAGARAMRAAAAPKRRGAGPSRSRREPGRSRLR
jgi:hypothetical protein